MRVCLFCGRFPPAMGGAEFASFNLANALTEAGIEVVVQAIRRPDRKELDYGYPVRNWRYVPVFSAKVNRQIHLACERFFGRFDILHAVSVSDHGQWAASQKKFLNRPLVVTSHGSDVQVVPEIGYGASLDPNIDRVIRMALAQADAIVAVSKKNMLDLVRKGASPDRIQIIHNGCQFEKIDSLPVDRKEVRTKLGISDDDFVIVSVGRNHAVKGWPFLLQAVKRVSPNVPNLKIILVGLGDQFEDEVKKHGLSGRVVLIDRIPQKGAQPKTILKTPYPSLIGVYKSADLYVNASLAESFSMTAMDAMACGLPVVITHTSGIVDLLEKEKGGLIYPPKDVDALAKGIVRLAHSPELRGSMAAYVRSQASEWNWRRVARDHIRLYESLLSRNRKGSKSIWK